MSTTQIEGTSLDIVQDLINQLKQVVPQAFTEGKLDVNQLKKLIGEGSTAEGERYALTWAGKSEAYKVLQTATTCTLIPERDKSIKWDETENVLIEGENLEVLKVLQKSYFGKVKMIYIDPPYNTGNDSFIYPDKFSETKEDYLKRIGDKDDEGLMMREGLFRKNTRENGQFHSNWLNMMLPRLFLARNLLKDDGVIFVSIDDNEQANLKLLMDEVFGAENFVNNKTFIWHIPDGTNKGFIARAHEYILCYAKNIDCLMHFNRPEDLNGESTKHLTNAPGPQNPKSSIIFRKGLRYEGKSKIITGVVGGKAEPIEVVGEMIFEDGVLKNDVELISSWKNKRQIESFLRGEKAVDEKGQIITEVFFKENGKPMYTKKLEYLSPKSVQVFNSYKGEFEFNKSLSFDNPKPVSLIKFFISLVTGGGNSNDLILDFFAGSGTTAQAVLELNESGGNRKFICVQLPESVIEGSEAQKAGFKTIADITQERIKRVIQKIEKAHSYSLEMNKRQSLGFRKYRLEGSNFKVWRGDVATTEEELKQQMELFAVPQRANATTENIVWELLIKNGYQLTEHVQTVTLPDGEVIFYTQDKRIALVLDTFTQAVQDQILILKPKTVLMLDSLFTGRDNDKTNTQLKFEDNSISFKTV